MPWTTPNLLLHEKAVTLGNMRHLGRGRVLRLLHWTAIIVRKSMSPGLAGSALLTSQAAAIKAGEFVGRASVVDGDTLDIHGTRIRLWGIDAPETSQLCRGDDTCPIIAAPTQRTSSMHSSQGAWCAARKRTLTNTDGRWRPVPLTRSISAGAVYRVRPELSAAKWGTASSLRSMGRQARGRAL
jgi:hypothetical protein